MPPLLALLALAPLLHPAHAHPADWLHRFSASAREDGSWFWGWAWAADGAVSIVDRSPSVTFPARPASFGLELAEPLLGYVIPLVAFTVPCAGNDSHEDTTTRYYNADPVQGCPHLCVADGGHSPDPNESWIALVQRGGCPFVEKARQAQRLGAKAVVVGGDSVNPDALLNMYSERDSSDVTIAATFIKYWDYVELLSLIAASNTTHSGLKTLSLLLSTEYSAWEWYSPIITFIVILLLPSLLTFITLVIHRVRAARAAQRDRAPEDVVHGLPWRVWTGTGWEKHEAPYVPGERDVEAGLAAGTPSTSHDVELPAWVEQQVECAICLEEFAKNDRVRVLPCYHMFHMDEVDEWLIHKKKLCPVCKLDVTRPHPPSTHASPHSPPDDHEREHVLTDLPSPTSPPAQETTPLLQDNAEHRYHAVS
ncbi:hypothetical protein WOLCODRAFT_62954 [Wolfiporia cocos MD-104 SS10]|uniref:RING-type E3 ubiquitin transferase n=1 Tax=Wolfiporia cocos (strain MD-104) TaxID=742152 RepID=A0A2H3J5A7_WOLCO|nr:hypothetical protein WOLCODRAFT_62954 [Wolfiporia cocos MD-104 SS10]